MSEGVSQAAPTPQQTGWQGPRTRGGGSADSGGFGETLDKLDSAGTKRQGETNGEQEQASGEVGKEGGGQQSADGQDEARDSESAASLRHAVEIKELIDGAFLVAPQDAARGTAGQGEPAVVMDNGEIVTLRQAATAEGADKSAIVAALGNGESMEADGNAKAAAALVAAAMRGEAGGKPRAPTVPLNGARGADTPTATTADRLAQALEPAAARQGGDGGQTSERGEAARLLAGGQRNEQAARTAERGFDPMRFMPGESGRADNAAGKVNVINAQSAPAPVAPGPTAASLVTALDADGGFRSAAADPAATAQADGPRSSGVVHSLKIQLHPANLGMVTAQLRITGGQLAVELQVENSEARHRLATDSDAIVRALRTSGYEIDKVTILQATSQNNTATGSGNPTARDGAFQAGAGNDEGTGGRSSDARDDGHEGKDARHGGGETRDQAASSRGGLYI